MTRRRIALLATACAAAFALYLAWPCRIPTPWPMFVAGKLCRTFSVRARRVASGVSPIPAGAPNRSAFVRSGAELEAFRAQWAIAVPPPDWDRESLLFIASPGADAPPDVERIYQWWDTRGTVVAVLSKAPGPRGAARGGWVALALDRSSLWREPQAAGALLRDRAGQSYPDHGAAGAP